MPQFDVKSWLDRLAPDERVGFLRGVLGVFEKLDPGFVQCSAIWRRSKTVRVTVKIPDHDGTLSDAAVHMLAEDGPVMLDMLSRRLKRGEISLERGKAMIGKGEEAHLSEAYMAPVGRGAVMMHVMDGEILINVTPQQIINVPEAQDGQAARGPGASAPGRDPASAIVLPRTHDEGFRVLNFNGQLFLVVQFNNVRSTEVKAVRKSPVTLGLVRVTDNLMVMAAKLPGLTDGWADMPFALGVEPPENRRLVQADHKGHATIMLALVEGRTGVTVAIRALRMSRKWTNRLNEIIEDQQDASAGYDRSQYLLDVEQSRRRWPNADDIRGSLEVVEVARDIQAIHTAPSSAMVRPARVIDNRDPAGCFRHGKIGTRLPVLPKKD